MNLDTTNLTIGRTDDQNRPAIGFDAKRVLAQRQRGVN